MTGQAWRARFDKLDHTPWPGPRPIPTESRDHVLGRDSEGEAFLAAVTDHLLVVLTADSGVGKSSLLNGKLIPGLNEDGFLPVSIEQWHLEDDEDPDRLVARRVVQELATTHPDHEPLDPNDGRFWQWINEKYGDRLVLVLDQFEELIRFQAGPFRRIRDWIADLNNTTKVRVVISLRSEYHHQLRPLERSARPFTMTTIRLEPIAELGSISQIVEGPEGHLLPEGEVAELVGLWKRASMSEHPPGLLHLQALLYVLHHSRGSGDTTTIEDINRFCERALPLVDPATPERLADAASGTAVFELALQEAVGLKLIHCRRAAADTGYDRVTVDGTDALVHTIAPHLSSGGFKLVLDEWTVAQRALSASVGRFRFGDEDLRNIADLVTKHCLDGDGIPCTEPWPGSFPKTGQRTHLTCVSTLGNKSEWTYSHDDWVPWSHDEHDLSSGPMLGMEPRSIAAQELRRFAFAMSWLEAASLVRRSIPVPGQRIVALIHDGFGSALERAYASVAETFGHSMARLTGARGEELTWSVDSIEAYRPSSTSSSGQAGLRLLNVRWRDCTVRDVEFSDAVFVNGDFRGTRFEECHFRGVTFINCLLDNASFVRCHLIGGGPADRDLFCGRAGVELTELVAEATAEGDRRVPDFRVDVHKAELAMMEQYRRCEPSGGSEVYSRTSGIAAHAVPNGAPAGIQWTPATGGLAVFGGRLSSLMFSGCSFKQSDERSTEEVPTEGLLALRHIAGAALDLVEHSGGRIEVFDSVIRGMSVTSKDDPGDSVLAEEIRLDVLTAIMAGTWFDANVRGAVRFRDCVLTQLVSLAPEEQLAVETDLIKHHDISVATITGSSALTDAFESVKPHEAPPWSEFEAMDYRSRPARAELDGSAD